MKRSNRSSRPTVRGSSRASVLLTADGDGSTIDMDFTAALPAGMTYSRGSIATLCRDGYVVYGDINAAQASAGPNVPSGGGAWSAPLNSVSAIADQNNVAGNGRRITLVQAGSTQVTLGFPNTRWESGSATFWCRAGGFNQNLMLGFFDTTTSWGTLSANEDICEYVSGFAPTSISSASGNLWNIIGLSATDWTLIRIRRLSSPTNSLNFYPGGASPTGQTHTLDLAAVQCNPGVTFQPLTVTTGTVYTGPRFDDINVSTTGWQTRRAGLLIEPERSNFINDSNGPAATTGVTVARVTTGSLSPELWYNARRITKTDATTPRYAQWTTTMTVTASTTYTASAWFRHDGSTTTASLEFNDGNNWGGVSWVATFNVTASGVSVAATTSCTARVTQWENNWYRVEVTFTSGATITTPTNPSILARITGAASTTYQVYGVQLEIGDGATSYMPTVATSIKVRSQDNVQFANVSAFNFDNVRGTCYMNFRPMCSGTSFSRMFTLRSTVAPATEAIGLATGSTYGTAAYATSRNGGSPSGVIGEAIVSNVALNQQSAIAWSLDAENAAAAMTASRNGTSVSAARTNLGPTQTPTVAAFNNNSSTTSYPGFTLSKFKFFPFAMAASQLNAMTAVP